ncbi:hypothetical protein BDV95DRAFT_598504 [Massariosphaeria phaeospora]|uniref:Uncharacterized protein n=1 Tax=Massariosphaeria phaeospora TaxID=100035 RepID=A0A7C8I1R6_9PLEO|nr:hypothetical protein BDV95DRAFT_598504 [Massariosphaeria phaeospora]
MHLQLSKKADRSGSRPTLISDGRRMRQVWKLGDGDGDPSTHLVERSLNTLAGHPTWKVFDGPVSLPVERGSEDEPPHFVYLDDRACHAVHYSDAYTHEELKTFWPFDFNHQGHIRGGRRNRGRPAYLDDSYTAFAQGRLRGKDKWYEFSGAPEFGEYAPARPTKPTKMEEQVAQEFAEQEKAREKASSETAEQAPSTPERSGKRKTIMGSPAKTNTPPEAISPRGAALGNTDDVYPSSPISRTPTTTQPRPRPTPSSSRSDNPFRYGQTAGPQPLALTPRPYEGSPYGHLAAGNFRAMLRPYSGDLEQLTSKPAPAAPSPGTSARNPPANTLATRPPIPTPAHPGLSRAKRARDEPELPAASSPQASGAPAAKRRVTGPFLYSSSESPEAPKSARGGGS